MEVVRPNCKMGVCPTFVGKHGPGMKKKKLFSFIAMDGRVPSQSEPAAGAKGCVRCNTNAHLAICP